MVDFGGEDGTCGAFPTAVGENQQGGSVVKGDFQLKQQSCFVPVEVPFPLPSYISAVPSVAEDDADGVVPVFYHSGNIINLVLQAFVVAGPSRGKLLVARPDAIEVHPVQSAGRNIKDCFNDHFLGTEFFPQ